MNQDTIDFIEELKQRPDVLGIILFGSWARGNNRPDSDVDLGVILTHGFKRGVEYRNKQAFEIIYSTKEATFEYWENHKDDAHSLWEVAKVLYDKDGTVKTLKEKVEAMFQKGKPAINKDQIEQFRFDAEEQIKYVKTIVDSDPTTANLVLYNKVFALTELFFDLRRLWTPAPKQRLAKIKEVSPDFYSLLEQFYKQDDFQKKLRVAEEIIPIVFKL